MLHRFDTLLARIVMLVIMAVLSTFILVFVIVQFQMSSRDDLPGRAMRVAQSALSELQVQGWPQSLPVEELKRLKVDDYFVGDHPIARPGSSYREEELRAHLGLADNVAVGVRFFGPRMGRPGEFRELTEFGPPEDGGRPIGPPDTETSGWGSALWCLSKLVRERGSICGQRPLSLRDPDRACCPSLYWSF